MNKILRQDAEAIVHATNESVSLTNAVTPDTKRCF